MESAKDDSMIIINDIAGNIGRGLYINDYRVAGTKPYGLGYIRNVFSVPRILFTNIFASADNCELEVLYNELYINGELTQGKQDKETLKKFIDTANARYKRFIRDDKHNHNWQLCMRYRWKLEKTDYEKALKIIN